MGEIRDVLKNNLNYLFKASKMTNRQIAEKLNVSPSSLTNWTKGSNSPDIETIALICKLFNISIVDLFEYDLQSGIKITPSDESVQQTNNYTPHEEAVIAAYRKKPPEAQKIIDAALGVGPKLYIKDEIKKIEDSGIIEAMTRQKPTKS